MFGGFQEYPHNASNHRVKTTDNKPPTIIEEIIAKYAIDANLFRLGSTNPKINAIFLGF